MAAKQSDSALKALADQAGLLPIWIDAFGREQTVKEDVLRTMLNAMDLPCDNDAQAKESLAILREEAEQAAGHLIVVTTKEAPVFRYEGPLKYSLTLENGKILSGTAKSVGPGLSSIAPVVTPGYHRLSIGDVEIKLAICPESCPSVADLVGRLRPRAWGLAAQIYSLRGRKAGPRSTLPSAWATGGDFSLLGKLAAQAAGLGASALAISPVHAMFTAAAHRYSPYSPSSRLFLNVAYIDPAAVVGEEALRAALHGQEAGPVTTDSAHLDWQSIVPARLNVLGRLYEYFSVQGPEDLKRELEEFRRQGGEALESHAIFEALHTHYTNTLGPESGWGDWPAALHDPSGAAVKKYAKQHEGVVSFHVFLQWLANQGLKSAQSNARAAGMPIGLIADLAIGTDPRGSHAWSRQKEILANVSVGAPPDIFQADGQNWGLTAFSPRALRNSGYAAFIETLRAVLAHAGGIRIDHVLGLARMWIIAQGAEAADGVYLRYPLEDMLRLVALEAWRHKAVVVGENLGTVPEGFNEILEHKGVLGTSVLWFERDFDASDEAAAPFTPAREWPKAAMATTTTHDLPTVNGWWKGQDLRWRERLGGFQSDDEARAATQTREQDKKALWEALCAAVGATDHNQALPQVAPRDAVLSFVARSSSPLVIIPMEDLLGIDEQPNLPGTTGTGHPNWVQTLPVETESVFSDVAVHRSIAAITAARAAT